MRIFAFHLLNDFSGSPKVLSQLIKGWDINHIDVQVCSSFQNNGFLSGIPPWIKRRIVWYRFYDNKLLRVWALVMSQFLLLVKFFFIVKKEDVIYVNTVLPFGAGLLGKLKGCRVIYHIHETTMKPAALKSFLFGIVKLTADDVVYVSQYLASQEPMPGKQSHVLYNAIPEEFVEKSLRTPRDKTMPQNVLMVCSLKVYKGVFEFVRLAKKLKQYRFRLILNAPLQEIEVFFKGVELPENLEFYPTQRDVIPHYAWADLIMNLSHPDSWVETFGLTIIEGMAFDMPAVVPPVGGITEVVDNGFNGFHVNPHDIDELKKIIQQLFLNARDYARFSENAGVKLNQFREKAFIEGSLRILEKK